MAMTNTHFFRVPTSGKNSAAYTYEGPKAGHRLPLDDILVRQQGHTLARNVTMHPKMGSDHRLVSATIRLVGQTTQPLIKTEKWGQRSVLRPEAPRIRRTLESDCFAGHCRQARERHLHRSPGSHRHNIDLRRTLCDRRPRTHSDGKNPPSKGFS